MQDVDAKSQSEINSILAFLLLVGTSSILVLYSTYELQTMNTEVSVSSNNNSIVKKLFRAYPLVEDCSIRRYVVKLHVQQLPPFCS